MPVVLEGAILDPTEERDIYSSQDWTDEEVQAYLAAAGKGYIDSIHIERSTVSHWGLSKDGFTKAPVSKRCSILVGFQHDVPQISVSAPLVKQAAKQVLVMLEKKIEQLENILIKKGKLPPRGSEDTKDDKGKREEAGSSSGEDSRRAGLAGDGGGNENGAQNDMRGSDQGEGSTGGEKRSEGDKASPERDVRPGENS